MMIALEDKPDILFDQRSTISSQYKNSSLVSF